MKSAKIVFIILLLLSFLRPSRFVHADVAPPPAPKLGGLEPFAYQDTEVQMLYERVEMELHPFYSADLEEWANRIFVSAYFLMHNQGAENETMQAIFPLEDLSCGYFGGGVSYTSYQILQNTFTVSVDGTPVAVKSIVTPHPRKIADICEEAQWAAFDVSFPVGTDVLIHINYEMGSLGNDVLENIDYILETGAGWKGPIKQGYIIMKFPYTVGNQNVLSGTTSGYQTLYNEIYWSFQDLEPTIEDNIHISIVGPNTWKRLQTLQQSLAETPGNASNWLELAYLYESIAHYHGDILRNEYYLGRIVPAYEQGIAANPNSAELYAKYAEYQLMTWSPRLIRQITEDEAAQILSLLNKAFILDSNNETAQMTLSNLISVSPFITFTPPPTSPPTATSLFTATPSITPSVTLTPVSGELQQPLVVTVIHTKLVKAPTPTQKSEPTRTNTPTKSLVQDDKQNESGSSPMIFAALVIFAAGLGLGTFWSRKFRK